MNDSFSEIYRVLKLGAKLVVATTNPKSIGYDYVSYRYIDKPNLKSGDKVTCVVRVKRSLKLMTIIGKKKTTKKY